MKILIYGKCISLVCIVELHNNARCKHIIKRIKQNVPVHAMMAYLWRRFITSLFFNLGTGRNSSHPDHFTPEHEGRYPMNRRLGGPQRRWGGFGEDKNLQSISEFESRTVQSVA
jgi:hypothetical protein